jgi:tetratricopeptide (TPR) repeat protein
MTERETPDESSPPDDNVNTAVEEPTPEPAPEPWTPERVTEWNRYYDLYVAAGVLLLVFIGSAHPISNPALWSQLQAGRLVGQQGPVVTDQFSYTMQGHRWVNIPWTFEWINATLYDAVQAGMDRLGLKGDGRALNAPNREQVAAGVLVGLSAFLRALTALIILNIRRPGPGLWWSCICALFALGAILVPLPGADRPFVPILGGIAQPAEVASQSWGLVLFALELWLIHRAAAMGRPRALLALVPVFLLWANLDDSFLYGLIVLAAATVGMVLRAQVAATATRPIPSAGLALGVLAACAAIVLVNPSHVRIYPTAASPLIELVRPSSDILTHDRLSFFGSESRAYFDRIHSDKFVGAHRLYLVYYLVIVGIGLASFVLNRRRFAIGRFLVYAVMAVLWGALVSLAPEFALVWAVTLALNGQEWYQDQFGTEGRLGSGWALWSVGGRAVTLLVVFAMLVKGLTGYGASPAEPAFGFGVNPDDFAFEAADYIADAGFAGNVFNMTLSSGDAIVWRAWPRNPERKTFADGRPHLFPPSIRVQMETVRRALNEKDKATWQPILDRYNVTVVMLPFSSATRTYAGMADNPDWIPFYDDGHIILFGRADAPAADLAYFREHQLIPDQLAYRTSRDVPSSDRTPTPTSYLDRFFQNRGRRAPQPHVWSAERWLTLRNPNPDEPPSPALCLLAIGELRTALARNPDDATAWRLLASAYRQLGQREGEILSKETGTVPTNYLLFRSQQRAAVLNFAIQSTPPPRTQDAKSAKAELHLELGQLYLSTNYFDLARDQFEEARQLSRAGTFGIEEQNQLAQLDEIVERVNTALSDLSVDQQQFGPMQRIEYALSNGTPGIAIREMEEAEDSGLAQGALRARLIDLYCQVGWPDKAFELLGTISNVEDPSLNTGPGTASYRQGLVYFLIGNYELSAALWRDRALPQLRSSEGLEALEAARSLLRGLPREASEQFQALPGRISTQAVWESELGFCLLEAGKPSEAAEHFETALTIEPNFGARPLLEYYLEQLGRPIPPAPEPEPAAEPAAPEPAAPAPSPAPTATDLPPDPFQKPAGSEPRP